MSNGIKLEIDDVGDVNIAKPEIDEHFEECLIDSCDMAEPGYICGHDGVSIWRHFDEPGYCPLLKWYRETKIKEFCIEERKRARKVSNHSFIMEKEEKE